eukprot:TRINITY_DN22111_c0_g1_i1.p1 TRINITY_DN22111_c0_g1~~TRINITY_DN22111_c0_g1_i1.p1  ORF type:complete len:706 (-),score=106.85 TRINITY_DN22111_c0_g1_i1:153-2270(-)
MDAASVSRLLDAVTAAADSVDNLAGNATAEDGQDAEDTFASVNLIIVTTSLLALISVGYRINTNRLRHVPESGAAMLLGFAVGLVVSILNLTQEQQALDFRGEIFFYVLLPPIIFEAGLSLETRIFVDNLGAISAFAVGGTLISTIVVSKALHVAAQSGMLGFALTPELGIQCQLFGALISATDPVATMSLFSGARFKADPLLHALVNGESVLNDAVAIVLFSTLSHHLGDSEASLISFPILGHFCIISMGSLLVGILAGAACSWSFRKAAYLRRFPDYEISALGLAAYLTFAISQLLGLSGIVALFFFGIVLAHYNWYNLSEPSKVASKVTFGTLAKLAESCVFLYLGIVAALSVGRFHWHLPLVFYTVAVILVARAAHIFPLSIMLNMGRRRKKIDRNMSVMMWISGLRGAIAFALALRIPCSNADPGASATRGSEECQNSDLFVTTTICVVMLTTLGVGTAMEKTATALRVVEPVGASSDGLTMERQLMSPRTACSLELSVPLASGNGSSLQQAAANFGDSAAHCGGTAAVDDVGAAYQQMQQYECACGNILYSDCRFCRSCGRDTLTGPGLPVAHLSASSSGSMSSAERGLGDAGSPGSLYSPWSEHFLARGPIYQAFARFDFDVLQPIFGGPCMQEGRSRRRSSASHHRSPGGPGGRDIDQETELPSLKGFIDKPGWSRLKEPQSNEDEAPTWSRSFVFE